MLVNVTFCNSESVFLTSNHNFSTFQRSDWRSELRSDLHSMMGSFGKRWISSAVKIPDCRRPRTARPLSAPKSKARYALPEESRIVNSGIGRDAAGILRRAFLCDALQVATLPERLHRISRQAF